MITILWDTMPVVQYTGTVIFTLTMENLKSHKQHPSSKHKKTSNSTRPVTNIKRQKSWKKQI
jgi:hypothetical protein